MSKKTYFIATFGCQANEADSERIAAWYEDRGWVLAKNKQNASEIVFNSCSVRQSAEDRVIGQVYQIKKNAKNKKGKNKKTPKIILTGCMTRLGKKYLKKKIPGIDEIWPIDKFSFNLPSVRKKKTKALMPIMTGCDNFCSYCVVPYARGREWSRPIEEILCEVKALLVQGYDSIMLLGQNVNSYHKNSELKAENKEIQLKIDKYRGKYKNNFAILLNILNDLSGLKKISFLSSNPHDLNNGIIKALGLAKIDRYLHLALQSGDDKILKKMNRKYSSKDFFSLVKKIRREVPDISIGTDIIVGFPGETVRQFENTVTLCKKIKFSKAYVSKYSPRIQTAAYKLVDDIPFPEKKRRWQILNNLINK